LGLGMLKSKSLMNPESQPCSSKTLVPESSLVTIEESQSHGNFNACDKGKRNVLRAKSTHNCVQPVEGTSKTGNRVHFGDVTLLSFERAQGFDTVPSTGIISIGMENKHHSEKVISCDEFDKNSLVENTLKRNDRKKIRKRITCTEKRKNKQNRRKSKSEKEYRPGRKQSKVAGYEESSDNSESKKKDPSEKFYIEEPLRNYLLKGVKKDNMIVRETKTICESRKLVGCKCPDGMCSAEQCECAVNGIECNVEESDDGETSQCNCNEDSCKNKKGRRVYHRLVIESHWAITLARINDAIKMGMENEDSPRHIKFDDACSTENTATIPKFNSLKGSSIRSNRKLNSQHLHAHLTFSPPNKQKKLSSPTNLDENGTIVSIEELGDKISEDDIGKRSRRNKRPTHFYKA